MTSTASHPAPSPYQQLFAAYGDARSALAALQSRPAATDLQLSRDPDYMRLHMSGMIIARFGGGPAIIGAIDALSKDGACQTELRRYWAGMEAWPSTH